LAFPFGGLIAEPAPRWADENRFNRNLILRCHETASREV
jgi:hypothetical protein